MAEGIMNSLGAGRFRAFSAGSHPAAEPHPLALKTLAAFRLPAEGYRSKDWQEFAGPDALPLDFVFTVCDKAAGEVCPVWPGQPMTAHWGVPDPVLVDGSDDRKARAFRDTITVLKRRIELLLALPVSSLDRLSLQKAIDDIGRQ
jgi:arsenate reductase